MIKLFDILKNGLKMMGQENVTTDIAEVDFIAKVDRRNGTFYIFWFLYSVILFLASILLISLMINHKINLLSAAFIILMSFLPVLFFAIVRLREGDTVIVTRDGIWEVTWLTSKYIRWSEISSVQITMRGRFTFGNIRISDSKTTIVVNDRYNDYGRVRDYVMKLRD